MLLMLLSFVLVLANKTTSEIFFKFAEIVLGIYTVGNISDKLNDTKKEIADMR